ncbi:DNA-binding transcriptional MocR family regulator [Brevundimonas nasdae]|uniref:MocR-like transcription factor YczR n=1 Tax=Brevundimonas nasdae TaxID=172043 RepID=UPI0019148700|nr:PLP-dependent aminotransferase family protein [Brevundimonas nasdae]MBK6024696.1 PLP-dependent aminotransferase family protein [Brevundimonas nasdae]MDQ0451341.1 DNA-binding transcriptional MocR family regulator [Brevundimonas nasdae]
MTPRTIRSATLIRHLGDWRRPGAGAAYRQLAGAVRLLILDGRLPLDARLPGERELAQALGLSRTTVSAAYGGLRDDGFLTGGQGAAARTSLPPSRNPSRNPGRNLGLTRPPAATEAETSDVIDLTAAVLPADPNIHAAYVRALERLPANLPGHGYETAGLEELREAVAAGYRRRGLPTSAGQILITHGAHNGLVHLLRLTVRPGDAVVFDHPTYPQAIDAILAAGARPIPVALPDEDGEEGWDVEGLACACRRHTAPMAYLVLDHNNPTGRMMRAADRLRLLSALKGSETLLVLDETLVELTLSGPPALTASAVDAPRMVRLGSMSKSVWGGLRIGWIRADRAVIQRLAQSRASFDLGVPILEQLAAVELLNDGGAALAARRPLLRARRDHLRARLAERLPDWVCPRPAGGLSLWARLPGPVSSALVQQAGEEGVRLAAGPRFGIDGAFERRLRLPYTLPEAELDQVVERLARAAEKVGRSPKSTPSQPSRPVAVY